ncbi:hypothetical protein Salat_0669100 [Sesamum alatum]|uniref:Uncharacterized protein n=1 Tax=Sesamum alatum TaxID=300844 RepID=A0AAE1YSV5_9LAMI|nr:hypothetical protein Salat_0669100 [Sesamum alatum]
MLKKSLWRSLEVAADVGPSKKRRRKHKKHRSNGSSKSSKRSQSRSELRAAKDAAEEKENTKHLKEMVVWWKQAREELKAPSSRTAEMEGEKLIPDWAISARSSVLRSVAMAFSHNLSLKCSMFRHQKGVAELKIVELQKETSAAHQKEKDMFDAKVALEAENANLKAQLHHAKESAQKAATNAFERGRIDGARDFLKTPTFKLAVDIQSARFLNEGFDKCVSQVDHLKGFVDGFDRTRLDPSLDATLQPYPEEATSSTLAADEFEVLASEVGCPLPL